MIKIHTEYNPQKNEGLLKIKKYKYKHTCTVEHLALIDRLIQEMVDTNAIESREKVLKLLEKPLIGLVEKETKYE